MREGARRSIALLSLLFNRKKAQGLAALLSYFIDLQSSKDAEARRLASSSISIERESDGTSNDFEGDFDHIIDEDEHSISTSSSPSAS